MIKPSLLSSRGERRQSRRGRSDGAPRATPRAAPATTKGFDALTRKCDPDAQRVRDAGGPVDQAAYACSCGYLFSADVSTTVHCPHCGNDQAW